MVSKRPILPLLLFSASALSALLILYPLRLSPHYTPVQSLEAIPHLSIFSLLMVGWIGSIVLLIFSLPSRPIAIFVTVLFASVFFGFWTVHLPYGHFEDWANMQTAKTIVNSGRIEETAHYWSWPATGLVGAIASEITGTEVVDLRIPIVLGFQIALALLMLAAFLTLLGEHPIEWAVFAVLIAILSNELLARFHFFPRNFALVLLLAASAVLLRDTFGKERNARASVVLLIILTLAIAAMHLVTSVLLFFMVAGSYIMMLRDGSGILRGPRGRFMLAFCGIIPWAWQLYWAVPVLERIVHVVPQMVGSVREQGTLTFFSYIRDVAQINTSGVPVWVSFIRFVWLLAVYATGTLIALRYLVRSRRIALGFRVAAVWFVAVGLVTFAGMILHPGGEQLERPIYFGSFLLSPIVLGAAVESLGKRSAALLTVCVLTSAAVPTLLINGNLVSTQSYYPQQRATGLFMQSVILSKMDHRPDVSVLSVGPGWSVAAYHSIGAHMWAQPSPDEATGNREEYMRAGLAKFADAFGSPGGTGSVLVLWDDVLASENFRHWFGQLRTRRMLGSVLASIERGNVVYDNGFARLGLSE